jgi:hypothetical protein
MSNIIVNSINQENIYLKNLKFRLNYYVIKNSCYNLNVRDDTFSLCDRFMFFFTLFVLLIFLIVETNYKTRFIINFNIFLKLWITIIVSELYIIINYYVRKCNLLYEENLSKYNILKYDFSIYSFILIFLSIVFDIDGKDIIIILRFNSLFLVFIFLRIFIKALRNFFVYVLAVNDNMINTLTIDEKFLLNRLLKNNILFTDDRFLKHEDLKLINYDIESSINQCIICYNGFENHEEIIKLPCGHHFHKCCILNWIFSSSSCPLCRTPLLCT